MRGMRRAYETRAAMFVISVLMGGAAQAQQQQQQGPTIEQRVGAEVGPIIVRAAALAAQVDQLNALVSQRDKTIADLQAELKAKADPPK